MKDIDDDDGDNNGDDGGGVRQYVSKGGGSTCKSLISGQTIVGNVKVIISQNKSFFSQET